ncbi:sugar/pyridoxal phosphate phosphatase YigL [Blochmannia endosymbiont of Colobopsis nipponica]|uniref:sugar/pyridoxal phosphate phosphatase YigL n=1 Tax=Blochmannia endosymbiont of Colobopsis nipponica TaxID=2681987 RepID=UPI001781C289|nr:sugar/pyridoxal phosphate phosphatase YigL [Blochmannia endosymbiont of Colobopsis nipponica]QOI10888.1 sugar/pyridoxal phosphate phosphatase YigL [Blochmannia endosymbiont of Colobopsis nipponica]QOI10898.1 sugar/pyridoxal phosphate phosphatase YigL [Blochmannia endosymbiont of Colobopsis nipponica]
MFHIVASDLDGTLLSSDHKVGCFTKQILQSLITQGIHFVFATGRHHVNVIKIRDYLNISAYMITSNGARVYDNSNELIFSHNLNENIALELFDLVYNDPKIVTNIFRNDEWYINRNVHLDKENYLSGFSFHAKLYQQNMLPADGICKVYFTSDDYQHLLNLERFLNVRWGDCINVSFSLPMCLEVMPGGVSKGYALHEVANLLGYDLQDCISFGDGMNDQEMLSMVGKGCIMRNAQQRLKDSLPWLEIIGSNEEEAVSHYLREMYLIKTDFL